MKKRGIALGGRERLSGCHGFMMSDRQQSIETRRIDEFSWPRFALRSHTVVVHRYRLTIMPRKPRYRIPGLPQHVVQRGNDRQVTFRRHTDYSIYRRYLAEALDANGCDLHAYCLMSNHVHLLLTPRSPDAISKVIQSVGRRYVQYFNRAYERTGTLWEGRYKANLVEDDVYALMCYRYVELNPVRAGIVRGPADYRYSSYAHNALGRVDPLIREHPVYEGLAHSEAGRRDAYSRLIGYGLADAELEDVREATRACKVLGSQAFKRQIAQLARRRV